MHEREGGETKRTTTQPHKRTPSTVALRLSGASLIVVQVALTLSLLYQCEWRASIAAALPLSRDTVDDAWLVSRWTSAIPLPHTMEPIPNVDTCCLIATLQD